MKIFIVENNFQNTVDKPKEPVFSMRPETSLLRNSQNFFFPKFTNKIVCGVSVFVRLSRIGRCIHKKFAHRYYTEAGICICFTAVDMLQNLQSSDKPSDLARCFDFSMPVSAETISIENTDFKNINVKLRVNNETVQNYNTVQLPLDTDEIISYISQFVSFKIGDIIAISLPVEATEIKIGDNLQAFFNDTRMLEFKIE